MKLVLDTQLIKIYEIDNKLMSLVKMSNGETLEMNSFNADLQGYIGALTLAQEVIAGKFWPKQVHDDKPKFTSVKERNELKLMKALETK
jgi:hypothetical protein